MTDNKHVYLAMVISFIAMVLQSFTNIFLMPVIINYVGVEAYGFVSLAKNFTSYASIVMMALNSYAARYMSVSYLQGNREEYRKYFNTVLFGDLLIGGVIIVVGCICVANLDAILVIPAHLITDVKVLFLLTFLTFYLTTAATAFGATAYVKNRMDIYNEVRVISYLAEIAVLLMSFLLFIPRVWYVGLSTLLAAGVVLGGSAWMTVAMVSELKISLTNFDFSSFRNLVINGFWNAANSVGNALNTGLDLLISNLMLSSVAMGQISIAKTISNIIYTLYLAIAQPFHPGFLKKYSDGDFEGLIADLKYAMKVCGGITNTIFAGFWALGLYFYALWIPTQDIAFVHRITVLAMLPCITEGCVYPLYYIYTLTVKNRFPCFVTIIGGLFNVAGMYFLLKYTSLGAYSIVITTAVVMNFINLMTNPLYMCHCLKIRKWTFYPDIIKNIISCTAAVLMMLLVNTVFPTGAGWGSFLIHAVICGIAGIVVQLPILFKPVDILKTVQKIKSKILS